MFFDNRKKRDEEFRQHLESLVLSNTKNIEDMEQRLENSLKEKQDEQNKLLRRQSASLEDILDELQCQGEDKESTTGQLQELKSREKALVELCCLLTEQREMILHRFLETDILAEDVRVGWQKQAELMEQEAEKLERRCTFQKIGEYGEKTDYDCHEILSVYATQKEEQNGTVAKVFSTGFCYQGKILKKAQVAVYKYGETGAE